MDAKCFDHLTRDFFRAASRRRMLAGLAAGLLAVMPLARGDESVAAKKKKGKKKQKACPKGQKACDYAGKHTCIPRGHCCSDTDCSAGECGNEYCLPDGSCGCLPGQEKHHDRCGTRPPCKTAFTIVSGASECCSGFSFAAENGMQRCGGGGNSWCQFYLDCASGHCRGFQCQDGAPPLHCLPAPPP
jgi:hypothetical protein